ncbi:hypothetical protein [Aureibacter tunicatorum]|uniref:Uncharacterized protein n=1 Tax=Aureibacter tunicatorum TaxID=866807 RepID=A0AAE3XQ84_9BACT|nr:hypothetical protein [Aureibacter tunicatorum]MDR6241127.1 hypothetical protein [Aureibacter tunicatorum]BDD03905.1 hypothetical protein AUTU_13880 [Aureibacter tunicatorum]
MRNSEEYIENRLKWRAGKNGLPSANSYFFDEIDTNEKLKFHEILQSFDIGKPVLLFKGENNTWTIIGTKMIASGKDSSFEAIEHSEIDTYTVGEDPMGIFSEPAKMKDFDKAKQHQIIMKAKEGRILTIHGQRGSELYAMLNIILMIDRITTTNEK